jgi:uncharacterized protein
MDFGKLTVEDQDLVAELLIFGTPGQDRFDFMWEVLSEGMDAFVLMVDLSDPESFAKAREILDHFTGRSSVPFVVGANKAEGNRDRLEDLHAALAPHGVNLTIVPCEALDRESARELLLTTLIKVLDELEDDISESAA